MASRKWTLTLRPNLRGFSDFDECLVHERTATVREASITCEGALDTPSVTADRDNSGTVEAEIGVS
jgi:hypothetical protein